MKKLTALILAGVMLFALAACGGGEGSSTQAPSQPPAQTAAPTEAPAASADLTAFYGTMFPDAVAQGLTLVPMEGDMLESAYPGLSALDCKQLLVYAPMMSAVSYEIILAEVADPADIAAIEAIVQSRIDYQTNPENMLYPETIENWENNCQQAENGNYYMLAVGEGAAAEADAFQDFINNGTLRDPAVPGSAIDDEEGGDVDSEFGGGDGPSIAPPIFVPGGPGGPNAPADSGEELPEEEIIAVEPAPEGSVDLEAFFDAVSLAHEANLTWVDDTMLRDSIRGIVSIPAYQRCYYVAPMTGVAQELLLVQVQNSEDVDAVMEAMQSRIQEQVDGGAWYPETILQWQDNSRVVSNGDYVMMIVNADSDAIVDEFNALFD